MNNKLEVMLYVEDIEDSARFWADIDFVVEEMQDLAGGSLVTVRPTLDSTTYINLYDIEEIKRVSPEVADNKPSILFHSDNLEELAEKVVDAGGFASEIVSFGSGSRVMNFSDIEGTFFAVVEDEY